jgi:hypothetical protein
MQGPRSKSSHGVHISPFCQRSFDNDNITLKRGCQQSFIQTLLIILSG